MKPAQPAKIPTLQEVGALGLIVTCANRDCRRRRWLELRALPKHATVTSVASNARCQVCGGKGAHVEVVQPLAEIGEQRGKVGAACMGERVPARLKVTGTLGSTGSIRPTRQRLALWRGGLAKCSRFNEPHWR